jgi:sulfur carrier protein
MPGAGRGTPAPKGPGPMAMIQIELNGERHSVPEGLTVLGLLESLGLNPERVAVELDREIVRRPEWPHRVLGAGARVEIVQFVGGG